MAKARFPGPSAASPALMRACRRGSPQRATPAGAQPPLSVGVAYLVATSAFVARAWTLVGSGARPPRCACTAPHGRRGRPAHGAACGQIGARGRRSMARAWARLLGHGGSSARPLSSRAAPGSPVADRVPGSGFSRRRVRGGLAHVRVCACERLPVSGCSCRRGRTGLARARGYLRPREAAPRMACHGRVSPRACARLARPCWRAAVRRRGSPTRAGARLARPCGGYLALDLCESAQIGGPPFDKIQGSVGCYSSFFLSPVTKI